MEDTMCFFSNGISTVVAKVSMECTPQQVEMEEMAVEVVMVAMVVMVRYTIPKPCSQFNTIIGGNGGDGGCIIIESTDSKLLMLVEIDVRGGAPGKGGKGGIPGNGGASGSAGRGGKSSNPSNKEQAANGVVGADGVIGLPGQDGKPGNPGKCGWVYYKVTDVCITNHSRSFLSFL